MLNTKANYKSIEKEVSVIINQREKDRAKIETELQEERAALKKAEAEKARLLEGGSKEEFLKACDDLNRAENSVQYMEKRAEQLKEAHGVKTEDLRRIRQDIKAEQDNFTRKALKEILAAAEDLWSSVNEALAEQKRGSEIYETLLSLYKADRKPDQSDLSGLLLQPYGDIYGNNTIAGVRLNLERIKNFLARPEVKNFIEGK